MTAPSPSVVTIADWLRHWDSDGPPALPRRVYHRDARDLLDELLADPAARAELHRLTADDTEVQP